MMKVRGCAPGHKDREGTSYWPRKSKFLMRHGGDLTIKVRVRNLMPPKGVKRMS